MTQETAAPARPHNSFLKFQVGDLVWWGPRLEQCNSKYAGPGTVEKVYAVPWQLRGLVAVKFTYQDGTEWTFNFANANDLVLAKGGAE